jgi:hypothetical protein
MILPSSSPISTRCHCVILFFVCVLRQELNPRIPINEYLLHRHESYLKLDFLTREISMDASSNREGGAKKTRGRTENNPLWNTIRAFVTAIIKFWSE